jgi:hypothetical protein
MKKYLAGAFAIALAAGASAFTPDTSAKDKGDNPANSPFTQVVSDPVFNWNHYTGSTSNPTITMVQLTQAEAEEAGCDGEDSKCLVKLDGQLNETNEIIKRPTQ